MARPVLQQLVHALEPYVDLWLSETVSSEAEMVLMAEVLAGTKQPWWLSYTLADQATRLPGARLRSGEPVGAAVTHAARRGARAVLFNCCQPEVISEAIIAAKHSLDAAPRAGEAVRVGAYANAFESQTATASANAELHELRADLGPAEYLSWAQQWLAEGADIIGGCCGVGPEHIALIRDVLGRCPPLVS
jgi:S-methylmethionine-dependent homocysteine/selenocysteine methylase